MPKIQLEKYRYKTLAQMILEGWPAEEIGQVMGLRVEVVQRFAESKGPAGFQKIYDELKEKRLTGMVDRAYRFVDMSDKAYDKIEETLTGKDARLGSDNAWRVLNEISKSAHPEEKEETGGITLNVARNMQVNAQAAEVTTGIIQVLKEMKKLSRKGEVSYEKHLKIGNEALPATVQEAMVRDADDEVVEAEVVEEGAPSGERDNNHI